MSQINMRWLKPMPRIVAPDFGTTSSNSSAYAPSRPYALTRQWSGYFTFACSGYPLRLLSESSVPPSGKLFPLRAPHLGLRIISYRAFNTKVHQIESFCTSQGQFRGLHPAHTSNSMLLPFAALPSPFSANLTPARQGCSLQPLTCSFTSRCVTAASALPIFRPTHAPPPSFLLHCKQLPPLCTISPPPRAPH
jgi:hypothetical protein